MYHKQAGLEGVGVGHNPAPLLFPNNGVPPAREDRAAGVAPPVGGAAALPAGEGAAPPVGGEAAPPVGGEAAPPAGGEAAPPAGEGAALPAEAIVPQEKVEQIARETVVLAVELLQKQKETVRNIALALNEIILLSHEFANSSIDLRLSDLRHLNNLSPPAADDEDDIVPKNVWVSGTIGITKYTKLTLCKVLNSVKRVNVTAVAYNDLKALTLFDKPSYLFCVQFFLEKPTLKMHN
ncbi:hypothetical protein [Candidatus Tisiphia endosymbiont of Dascillus cervinus]|uniref:hypothetical protein n=1 Tax=Candidatus Tisiphia endosymbiont of Dascillus cervinus TaxID=3066253 RepID=UPI00312C759B